MAENKNVPNIRFKGFSGEWDETKIQELIDKHSIISHLDGNHGELYPRANEFSTTGIPYISANDFVNGFMTFNSCKYLPKQRALEFRKGIAKDGDILFAHNATVGPVAKLETIYDFVILSTTATYFRCDNATLINDFFLQALRSKKFIRQYSRVMAQSTRNQVPITVQRLFSLSIPESDSEQSKIGNTFQKLDSLINLHQQKHDKLNNIKKAMLEKMFPKPGETTPEIRFKGFSGEWEEVALSAAAPLRGGFAFQSNEFCDSGIPIVKITNILATGEVGGEFNYYKEISNDENYMLFDGAALLAMSGATTGKVSVLKCQNDTKFYQNQRVGYFQRNVYFDYLFISTLVRSHIFRDELDAVLIAGAQPNVSSKEIDSFKFMMPYDIKEQEKIGNYFQKLDTLINQHKHQITKLNNIKQACLNKMFAG